MPPARRLVLAHPTARRAKVIAMSKHPLPLHPLALAGRGARRAFGWLPVALACAALAPAQAEDWAQYQFNAGRNGHNAGETAFTPDNVGSLRVAWKAHVGTNDAGDGGAAIAGGRLFVGTLDRKFLAFDLAGCGADSCEPLWQGDAQGGFTGTPGVSNGTVAIAAADGFLYAFSAQGCGNAHCAPLWRGRLNGPSIESSVAMVGGQVFVTDVAGQLSVFSLDGCGQDICDPVWAGRSRLLREQQFGTPAVGAGFVFVQTIVDKPLRHDTGRLLAFPLGGCGQAICEPAWVAKLRSPVGTVASPIVVGDKVIVGTVAPARRGLLPTDHTRLAAFPAAGCGTFVCEPVQVFEGTAEGFQVAAAASIDGTTLFATSSPSLGGRGDSVVSAYDLAHCGPSCKPAWRAVFRGEKGFSPPAVAGDVVFVGKGTAGLGKRGTGVVAFDARGCGKAVCDPLTFAPSAPQASYFGAPLAIADGKVAFVEDDADSSGNVAIMSLP
jgi:outer membrane protein assembly factor BamB